MSDYTSVRDRPAVVSADSTIRYRVGGYHGNVYVTVGLDSHRRPFEMFTTAGKAGGCDAANIDAITRLISLCLRAGVNPEEISRQLRGITCCPAWDGDEGGEPNRSIPDVMAKALDRYGEGQDGERENEERESGEKGDRDD